MTDRKERKILLNYFRDYNYNKTKYLELLSATPIGSLAVDYSKPSISGGSGQGLEQAIIKNYDLAEMFKHKCEVVEKVRDFYRFDDEMTRIINETLMRKTNNVYYGARNYIDRTTVFRRQSKILNVAKKWAYAFRLL